MEELFRVRVRGTIIKKSLSSFFFKCLVCCMLMFFLGCSCYSFHVGALFRWVLLFWSGFCSSRIGVIVIFSWSCSSSRMVLLLLSHWCCLFLIGIVFFILVLLFFFCGIFFIAYVLLLLSHSPCYFSHILLLFFS